MIEHSDRAATHDCAVSPAGLHDIVATNLLVQRTPKLPAFELQSSALRSLASTLATAPDENAQRLVDLAMKVACARSAGQSLLDTVDGEPVFRWVARSPTRGGSNGWTKSPAPARPTWVAKSRC